MHPLKRYKIFKTNSIDKDMPVETNPQIEVEEHRKSSSNFISTLHKKQNKQFKAVPSDQQTAKKSFLKPNCSLIIESNPISNQSFISSKSKLKKPSKFNTKTVENLHNPASTKINLTAKKATKGEMKKSRKTNKVQVKNKNQADSKLGIISSGTQSPRLQKIGTNKGNQKVQIDETISSMHETEGS